MREIRGLLPTIVVGVMGNSVIYLIPLLVGAMVSDRGFSEAEAGYMASVDLAGYAIATFLTALLLDRFRWHRMALAAVGLMIAANVATTFVHARDLFALVRFASGLGGGVLAAIATVSLGQTDKPDRNYGLLFAAALLFGTAGLWGLPLLLEPFGLNGAYWLIVVLAILVGFVTLALPHGRAERHDVAPRATRRGRWLSAAVLVSILLFWAEQNSVFAYIERIGNAAGLSIQYIGFSVGAANLTGFAGASLVAWMGSRVGRLVPVLVSTLVQIGCLVVLTGHVTATSYLVGIALIALAWNVANPFQLGVLAGVDVTGKALAMSATVTGAGLAIGPAAAALAIGGGNYRGILWLGGGLALAAVALLVPPLRAVQRQATRG